MKDASPRVASRLTGIELSLIRKVQLAAGPGAINLGLGEPTLESPAAIRHAVAEYARRGAFRYSPTAGDLELRARVARGTPDHGGEAASVMVTAGTQEALAVVLLGLLEDGDELLIPEIAYPAYRTIGAIAGAVVTTYPTPFERGFRPSAVEIGGRITERTRVVLLCSPANPTGAITADDDVAALEKLAGTRGVWLLSDEIYADIHLGPRPPRRPRGPATLVIAGPSKSHAMTGLRVGWLVGPPALLGRLLPLHQQIALCASTAAQVAAKAALDLDPGYGEQVRDAYRARWAVLRSCLTEVRGLRFVEPEGAFYALVDARERIGDDSRRFAIETARTGGVVVVPGESFGMAARGFLRISFASTEDEIRRGMARLAAALASFRR